MGIYENENLSQITKMLPKFFLGALAGSVAAVDVLGTFEITTCNEPGADSPGKLLVYDGTDCHQRGCSQIKFDGEHGGWRIDDKFEYDLGTVNNQGQIILKFRHSDKMCIMHARLETFWVDGSGVHREKKDLMDFTPAHELWMQFSKLSKPFDDLLINNHPLYAFDYVWDLKYLKTYKKEGHLAPHKP